VVLKCEYDGLGRRTKKFVNTSDPLDQTYDAYRHFFYSAAWQILETRRSESENDPPESENPEVQYVWSRRYIDAPVLRDRDVEAGGDLGKSGSGLDQRLYYTTDANMNVTALVEDDGDIAERYVYDPYGRVTVYSDDWSDTRSTSAYDNAILYCGYFFDNETGLYCVRYRFYVPPLGRWLQRDPAGYGDGMSLYEYVSACPTGLKDASGLGWTDWLPLSNLWKTPPGATVEDYAACKPSEKQCCLAERNATLKAEVIRRCHACVDLKAGGNIARWSAQVTAKSAAYAAVGGAMVKGGFALASSAPASAGTTGAAGICVAVGGGALLLSDAIDIAVGFWKIGKIKEARDAAKQRYCKCPPPA